MSFYVSTATFFLLHCDEWDRVVALPRHKFVTGATLLQLSDTPLLQYYDVQTLEYRYINKLSMKKERIWSNVKDTTSHLQNKLTKNIHLGVATRSSTKWDCLKPIRFHQYTWGLQHFLTFLQEDIGHIKCHWFKIKFLYCKYPDVKRSIKILFHSGIVTLTSNFWQEPYSFMHICRQCITTV